jgi:hypothetical protein
MKGLTAETVKSCLFCANACDYYFSKIAPECHTMLGDDASNLRQATAWGCEKYKREK